MLIWALSTTAYLYLVFPFELPTLPTPPINWSLNLSGAALFSTFTVTTPVPDEFRKSAIITSSDFTSMLVPVRTTEGVANPWSFTYPTAFPPSTNLPFVNLISPATGGVASVPAYNAYPSPLYSTCEWSKSTFPPFNAAIAVEAFVTFIELYFALIFPLLFANNPNPICLVPFIPPVIEILAAVGITVLSIVIVALLFAYAAPTLSFGRPVVASYLDPEIFTPGVVEDELVAELLTFTVE